MIIHDLLAAILDFLADLIICWPSDDRRKKK